MKKSFKKLAFIFLATTSLIAQEKKLSTSVSVAMNGGSSTSEGVSKSFKSNPEVGLNLFWGKFGAGLDVGQFGSSPNSNANDYVQRNAGFVKRVMIPTDRETAMSTYFLVGPQYMIRKGKMNIVLATKAGITINNMAEYQVEDQVSSTVLASYKAPENFVRNAFTLKPSLSIGYDLTKSFSLSANAQFIKQTGQQEFTTSSKDLSNVQTVDLKGNQLRADQISKYIIEAPTVNSITKGASEFMSFGLGLTYTIRATGKHFKDATISMAAHKEDNSGSTTTYVAQVSGEAAKTAGWKIPENTKVIVNPGSGSGNENTSESTKAKQSEAKSNLKANSESVNYDENNPPKPLQAAGIPGIKTKAIKKVGEVPLGKMKSSNNEDNPPQPVVTTNSVDIETLSGITEGTPIKGIIVKGGKNPDGSINPDAGNTTGTDNVNNYKIKMTDVIVTLAKVNDKGGEDASIKESEKPRKEVAHTPMKRSKTSEARSNLKSTKKSKPVKGQTKRGGKSSEAKSNLKALY